MVLAELESRLERAPIITAVADGMFEQALQSSAEVIFYLEASLLTLPERIAAAHKSGKALLVHVDLAEGLGRDRAALQYLHTLGADGIITTKSHLIKAARELGLLTVQRFFTLDTKGMNSVQEVIHTTRPDMIEIMPGIVGKVIRRVASGGIPVIAGGLIETKAEVTEALSCGAIAVSTGKQELWYI